MKFATLLRPSTVYMSRTPFSNRIGPMISKEMKYNLHYGEVLGDIISVMSLFWLSVVHLVVSFSSLPYWEDVQADLSLC